MLYAGLGRPVRIGKNCARGLEYGPRPQTEGRAQDHDQDRVYFFLWKITL